MESWIKVNKTSGTGNDTVSITVEPNESSEDRTGTVDVATSTLNKILSITQKGQSKMTTQIFVGSHTNPCYPIGSVLGTGYGMTYALIRTDYDTYANVVIAVPSSMITDEENTVLIVANGGSDDTLNYLYTRAGYVFYSGNLTGSTAGGNGEVYINEVEGDPIFEFSIVAN